MSDQQGEQPAEASGTSLEQKLGMEVKKDGPKKKAARAMNVAIVGATGVVGRETLEILAERGFPVAKLRLFASERSAGERIEFRGREIEVEKLEGEPSALFAGTDIAFFAASGGISRVWAPLAAEAGAVCIDKSSSFRMDPDVPLVVPEVNGHALANLHKKRIVATPNCSTIQMVQALAPLHRKAGLKRVVVCTYQAVSGAGREGIDELETQVRDMFNMRAPTVRTFDQRIAFNVLPRIPARDPIPADGTTGEERKMIEETRKILEAPGLRVGATCVRVPVFNGHSEAIHVELERPLAAAEARELIAAEPNVLVVDDVVRGLYPTAQDATGEDKTLVGRIRQDESVPDGRGLAFWCVSDNLRTGAALNAVRIAETLAAEHLGQAPEARP
jgi:aspartate-semialdehyde dehydrogenase